MTDITRVFGVLRFLGGAYLLAKLGLIVSVLGTVWLVQDYATDELTLLILSLEDSEINGYQVPVLGMLAYMGVFDGLSVVLGAYITILSVRTAFRVLGWL